MPPEGALRQPEGALWPAEGALCCPEGTYGRLRGYSGRRRGTLRPARLRGHPGRLRGASVDLNWPKHFEKNAEIRGTLKIQWTKSVKFSDFGIGRGTSAIDGPLLEDFLDSPLGDLAQGEGNCPPPYGSQGAHRDWLRYRFD